MKMQNKKKEDDFDLLHKYKNVCRIFKCIYGQSYNSVVDLDVCV